VKRTALGRNSIRQLKAGESVPSGSPRRYVSGKGYVRLRWKCGVRSYVEAYEHRVVDGRITTAEHVHHKNRDRADNRPENLEHLSVEEHQAEHQAESAERAARMAERYREGRSILQVSREFGIDSGATYRRLAAEGVEMRKKIDYAKPIDAERVLAEYAAGRGYKAIGRELGVSVARVRKIVEQSSVPLRGPGRVPGKGLNVGEGSARKMVRARSGGRCEIQIAGICLGNAMSFHHRKNRSQRGIWSASNGLDLCGDGVRGCHGAVTNTNGRRAEFEANGWIVPSHRIPAEVPVLLATDVRVLLDDVGDYLPVRAA
jgi:hypothetical protein